MNLLEKNINWSIEHLCLADKGEEKGCQALLEVSLEDIYLSYRIRTWRDAFGKQINDIKFYYTFKCPCCGEETFIKEDELPPSIQKIVLIFEKEKGRREIAKGRKHINC